MGSERPARFLAAGSGRHRGLAGGPLFDVASITAAFARFVFGEVSRPAASRRGPGPGKANSVHGHKSVSVINQCYMYFKLFVLTTGRRTQESVLFCHVLRKPAFLAAS